MSRSKNYTLQRIKRRNDVNTIIQQKGPIIHSIFFNSKVSREIQPRTISRAISSFYANCQVPKDIEL